MIISFTRMFVHSMSWHITVTPMHCTCNERSSVASSGTGVAVNADSQLRPLHLVQETCPPVQEGGERGEKGSRGRDGEGEGRERCGGRGRRGVKGKKRDESGKGNRDK